MTMEQIEKVLPGIYRIPVPLTGNPLKELNSYIVCGEGGRNLLVDTGFHTEECRQAILDGLSLLGIRMEKAKQMLRRDEYRIEEVAEQVGLGHDVPYFYQLFKRYTGMTPKEYRLSFL